MASETPLQMKGTNLSKAILAGLAAAAVALAGLVFAAAPAQAATGPITLVTAATPTANDNTLKNFFEGEGYAVNSTPAASLTPEAISLTTSGVILVGPDATGLAAGTGEALKGALVDVLIARHGDTDLVNGSGLATGTLTQHRVTNNTVSQVDVLVGFSAGNDVQVFSPSSVGYFLRESRLGAGTVSVVTDKSDSTRKLVAYVPAGALLADGSTASNSIGYASLNNFGNATGDYKLAILAVLQAL